MCSPSLTHGHVRDAIVRQLHQFWVIALYMITCFFNPLNAKLGFCTFDGNYNQYIDLYMKNKPLDTL